MDDKIKDEIIKLVRESRDAIVCAVDEDGFPTAKAMFRRANDGLSVFWLSTNVSARFTRLFRKNAKSSLYFFDPLQIHGLSLTGDMYVFEDEKTKRDFWRDGDEKYYAKGPTDPDYCMLRFDADKGRYYAGDRKLIFSAADMELLYEEHYHGQWQKEFKKGVEKL